MLVRASDPEQKHSALTGPTGPTCTQRFVRLRVAALCSLQSVSCRYAGAATLKIASNTLTDGCNCFLSLTKMDSHFIGRMVNH